MSKEKKEKTPKKDKKEKTPKKDKRESDDSGDEGGSDEGKLRPTAPIAKPLADLKTTKKILKVVKKGTCVTMTWIDGGGGGWIRWRDAGRGGARIQHLGEGENCARSEEKKMKLETDDGVCAFIHGETAAKAKQVRRGVKEVVKALKKDVKGVCVIAGDISPIDVITHVPILCEDADVPYCYVHSKEELGAAGLTKRPTSVMLILPEGVKGSVKMSSSDKKEFDDMYSKIEAKVKSM